jgi:hypothetical protein
MSYRSKLKSFSGKAAMTQQITRAGDPYNVIFSGSLNQEISA